MVSLAYSGYAGSAFALWNEQFDTKVRMSGVAVGTLYRHWPMKADLVAAVVEHSIEQMAEVAEGRKALRRRFSRR